MTLHTFRPSFIPSRASSPSINHRQSWEWPTRRSPVRDSASPCVARTENTLRRDESVAPRPTVPTAIRNQGRIRPSKGSRGTLEGCRARAKGGLPGTHRCSTPLGVALTRVQRFSPQFLLLRLRHVTTDQDNASETLATSFVQSSSPTGSSDVDDFVREFRELRKTYHKQMMWGDRWAAGKVIWRDE